VQVMAMTTIATPMLEPVWGFQTITIITNFNKIINFSYMGWLYKRHTLSVSKQMHVKLTEESNFFKFN
jgi:hypothetical protein